MPDQRPPRTAKSLSVSLLLCGSLLLPAGPATAQTVLAQSEAAPESLVIVSWGGTYAQSQVEALYKPFTETTGLKIVRQDYRGGLQQVRAQVEGGDVYWDVVDVAPADLEKGCEDGLFERLSLLLPPAPDGTSAAEDFLPGSLHLCAVGSLVWSSVIAVDSEQAGENQPDGLEDLFNLDDFPGRRGLRKSPKGNLEWALLADGVPADERPYSVIWDRQLWDVELWAIPKGSRNKFRALEFIRYATGTEALAEQTKWIPYGPARRSANALVGPFNPLQEVDIAPLLPTYPDNMATALKSNTAFWSENGEALVERFNAWLVQ